MHPGFTYFLIYHKDLDVYVCIHVSTYMMSLEMTHIVVVGIKNVYEFVQLVADIDVL